MAFERLRGLIGEDPDPADAYGFVHSGPPASKSKARVIKNGRIVYGSGPIRISMESIAAQFQHALGSKRFLGNLALLAVFHRPNRQRIDADNLLKTVLDAGTIAGAWDDDSQVTIQGAVLEYDSDRPKTIVVMCDCPSSLERGIDAQRKCIACGKQFYAPGKKRRFAKYCSRACRLINHPKNCPHCGNTFRPKTNGRYCSVKCRGAAQTFRAMLDRRSKTHCNKGHALDTANSYILKNGAKRCRKCQAAAAALCRQRRLLP